jgi:hypothetical protein
MRTVVSIGLSPKDSSSSWPISLIFRLSVPALRAAVLGSAGYAKARRVGGKGHRAKNWFRESKAFFRLTAMI